MAIVWVEIPAKNIERARKFYGALLQQEFDIFEDGPRKFFMMGNNGEGEAGVTVLEVASFAPSRNGPLPHLGGGDDLTNMLSRVVPAGGIIDTPKTSMGQMGFFATFIDTEGNTIALHSMS